MEEKKREIIVRTSYDEMEAFVMLPVIPFDESYTKDEIYAALEAKRVSSGVDDACIDRMISERIFGRECLVAKGVPVVDGKDGYYEFQFNTDLSAKPKVRADGSVDYWSIHVVEIVEEGQVIAIYHDPVDGKNGCTVTGKPLNAKRGRPLPPLTGRGFDRSEDNHVYTANTTGKIEKNESRIMILEVYEIFGNVDMKTGNVDFRGDVIVHGNVTPGMKIHATGTITVDGTVEAWSQSGGHQNKSESIRKIHGVCHDRGQRLH